MENIQCPTQFAKGVLSILRRVERVSFNALRAAGWVVLALALLGTVSGG